MIQFIRILLRIAPKDRLDSDIDILEKCTSFLNFFHSIKIDDPENEYDSHRKTCQCLLRVEMKQGNIICKHSTSSLK